MRVPWLSMPMFIFILTFLCAVCGKAFCLAVLREKDTSLLYNLTENFLKLRRR